MRRFVPSLLVAFLITAPTIGLAQGKVTKDPNKAGALTAKLEVDSRLQQKITYDSGYKRLHDITDDLSRISGVKILSGKSKDDWRVKDIPLVICVKDMPLGELLKNIATASHTYLGSERIGKDDPEKSYRIYRRSVDEAKIDSYFENVRKAGIAQMKWRWDAMVAYGKSKEIDGIPKNTWYLSKIIASLGDTGWNRLQDGLTLRIGEKDTSAAAKQGFDELYRSAWEEVAGWVTQEQRFANDQSADDTVKSAMLEIKYTDKGGSGCGYMAVHMIPIRINVIQKLPDGTSYTYEQCRPWTHTSSDVLKLNGKLPGLQPYPESAPLPSLEDDMDNPDMLYLGPDKNVKWPEVLEKKINLEKPEGDAGALFADFVRQLASVSGLNIITEDFRDQYRVSYRGVDAWYAKDTTVSDTLRRIRTSGHAGSEWFLCEKQNLLLGWAHDKSREGYGDTTSYCGTWRHHQKNLVSEDYLNSLRQRLNGDGLSFDEAIRLKSLSSGSFNEWINNTDDLNCLSVVAWGADSGWWMLYDALPPADKQLAKSMGLALGKFDADWIASFFRTQRLREDYVLSYGSDVEGNQRYHDGLAAKERAMSDPKIISTMVIRLIQKQMLERMVVERDATGMIIGGSMQPAPEALKLYSCQLEVGYTVDGANKSMLISYPDNARFPIRSPEREAEIIKAAR